VLAGGCACGIRMRGTRYVLFRVLHDWLHRSPLCRWMGARGLEVVPYYTLQATSSRAHISGRGGLTQRHRGTLARGARAFLLVRISGYLFGEGLSYFAFMLTFHPAAGHLIRGPLQAVVFPAFFCWFALRVRRRLGCGVLLGRFHFIHLSS
jgi:hypothetical protein